VCAPSATAVVHGIDTGLVSDVVSLGTASPSTSRVNVLEDPPAPATQRTTQAMPPTISPPGQVGVVVARYTR
jgi:hypothetical protein